MPSINVTGAAERLRAFGTNTPGHCLEFVWQAISQGRVHYISGGAASAYATWQATDPATRHNGDRNVPKDMPAYFGPRPGNALGDVIISNGDGTFTATDRPNGHVGICTLNERGIQIGRPYLGWAETMGGYTLTGTSTASSNSTILEPDMPLTPADIGLLLNSAAFDGGPSISVVLKTIHDELMPVQRVEGLIPVRQDNADTKTIAIRLEARLAALTAASTAAAAGATTTQVQAAAKAGAEEALAALSLTISTKP